MCICINCAFYKTCWIKKGINKIPKNYVNLSLNTNISIKKNIDSYTKRSMYIKILLNKFIFKHKYELDIIECESFCEKPGYWIK